MIHLSAKAFGRKRRAVGEPGVPRRLGCSEVSKVGDVAFVFVFLNVEGLLDSGADGGIN